MVAWRLDRKPPPTSTSPPPRRCGSALDRNRTSAERFAKCGFTIVRSASTNSRRCSTLKCPTNQPAPAVPVVSGRHLEGAVVHRGPLPGLSRSRTCLPRTRRRPRRPRLGRMLPWRRARARNAPRSGPGPSAGCCSWRPCSTTWTARPSRSRRRDIGSELDLTNEDYGRLETGFGLAFAAGGIVTRLRRRPGRACAGSTPRCSWRWSAVGFATGLGARLHRAPRRAGSCSASSRPASGPAPGGLATAALPAQPDAGQQHPPERRLARGGDDAAGRAGAGLRPAGSCAGRSRSSGCWASVWAICLARVDPEPPATSTEDRNADDSARCDRRISTAFHVSVRLRPAFPGAGGRGRLDQPLLALLPRLAARRCSASSTATAERSGQLFHLGVLHRHRRRLPDRRLRRQVPGLARLVGPPARMVTFRGLRPADGPGRGRRHPPGRAAAARDSSS